MKLSDAAVDLLDGRMIARESWGPLSQFVGMNIESFDMGYGVYKRFYQVILYSDRKPIPVQYIPTDEDLTANDWVAQSWV